MPEDRHSGTPGGGSGADVKSGVIAISDGQTLGVTFGTAFTGVPQVTVTLDPYRDAQDIPFVQSISATGFTVGVDKGHGGSNHAYDANWIATDAGDP